MNIFILITIATIIGLVVFGGLIWYLYMKARFKTVPSNEALIITGPNIGDPKSESNVYQDDEGRHMRVVRGGGYRMKMFQSSTRVSLKSFQLEIKTPVVWTKAGVGIEAEAVATVKVADQLQGIVKYAEQFLGKSKDEVSDEISQVLNTNLRAILSKMTVEEINSDREAFNNKVTEVAQGQLNNMGFSITSLGLSDISDNEGYLENLGKPEIAKIKKKADIAESDASRETEMKIAENTELTEKEKISRQMNVADSRREKDLKEQSILSETNKAQAQAEASGQLEKESRALEIKEKQLHVERTEKENELHLIQMERENDVHIQRQKDDVRRQQSETDAAIMIKQSEASYESRIKEGKAEAEVIREQEKAKADGLRERANALAENKDVMLAELMIKTMPEFARAIAEPLSNVENIRILDGGNGDGVNSLSNGIIAQMANAEEGLNQMTGFNLTKMLENVSDQKKTYAFEQNEMSKNNDLENEEAALKNDIDQTQDVSSNEKQ
ncbi:flotillin [Staphylococcus equorum]|uniref:flotillin family protein n=1 Tax=Staphylococcus equorum TaxID=246432 RepID=UPI0008531765|nr:SPFH domain-containing protein [Staphylococcus equorum]OEK68678.1 flotillin [Staphylococcus equorum]OEK72124.1 flotillin [Staphylococcus equorum]